MGWGSGNVATFSDEMQSSVASVMKSGRIMPLLSIGSEGKSTNILGPFEREVNIRV